MSRDESDHMCQEASRLPACACVCVCKWLSFRLSLPPPRLYHVAGEVAIYWGIIVVVNNRIDDL